MWVLGLGYDRDTNISFSNQFQFKKSHRYGEIKRLLIEKGYNIKPSLRINTLLIKLMLKKNNLVMTLLFLIFLLTPKFNSDPTVDFIKNIISNNDIEEKSTLKGIIESD